MQFLLPIRRLSVRSEHCTNSRVSTNGDVKVGFVDAVRRMQDVLEGSQSNVRIAEPGVHHSQSREFSNHAVASLVSRRPTASLVKGDVYLVRQWYLASFPAVWWSS